MSEKEIDQKISNNWKKTLFAIISGVALIIATNIITGLGNIRKNTSAIEKLEGSKVDQLRFNKYVKIQSEINILSQERQEILSKRVDELEEHQREIELEKLRMIDVKLGILETKIENLLDSYGMKTRDGEEVEVSLSSYLLTLET